MPLRVCLGVWLLLVPGCRSGEVSSDDVHIGLVGDPIRPTVLTQYPAIDGETIDQGGADTLGLYRPQDIGVIGERVLVLDTGNDRAVLFDMALEPLAAVGRSGAGPGELRAPLRMATGAPGELWIGDISNRRLTAFSLTGKYLRSHALSFSIAPFTLMSDGTIIIGAPTERHFAAKLDSGGAHRPFAPRPLGEEVAPGPFLPTPLVARTSGDTVHVFDNGTGALIKYDPEGQLVARRLLPEPLLVAALQRRSGTKEQLEGGGLRVLDIPLAKSLKATDDDQLLLMIVADDVVGLLIDARSYAARSIVAHGAAQDARWLRNARSAALAHDKIYLIADQHVVVYDISGQGRSGGGAAM